MQMMSFSCMVTKDWTQVCIWRSHQKTALPHRPYGLDLAPSDFHLFGPKKNVIRGWKFRDGEVIEEVKMWLQQIPEDQQGIQAHGIKLRKLYKILHRKIVLVSSYCYSKFCLLLIIFSWDRECGAECFEWPSYYNNTVYFLIVVWAYIFCMSLLCIFPVNNYVCNSSLVSCPSHA